MRIFFLLFYLTLFLVHSTDSHSQCSGNIFLGTQSAIDSFTINYGCIEVENLFIEEAEDGNITNLDGLNDITSIGSLLIIENNSALTNLGGLENLTYIGNDLRIKGNGNLSNMWGLQNLTAIEGELRITYNYGLEDLQGLQNLSTVGESVRIENNTNLNSLLGLQGLSTIDGSIIIEQNEDLTDISNLENLNSIIDGISIRFNTSLTNLNGLQNLDSISYLGIEYNESLLNLEGLEGISVIVGNLSIRNNNALVNLEGIDNLTSIEGAFWMFENPALTNLMGMENLESIGGYVQITDNDALADFDGLQNLSSIGDYLDVHDNISLQSINGLQGLSAIGGYLQISYNQDLISLDGLQNLGSVGADITIAYNNGLEQLNSFQNLSFIGGNLSIQNNWALISLNGFQSLPSLENNLAIEHNSNLVNLQGLDSLSSIGGTLIIRNNPNLISLEGLQNLESVEGYVHIRENYDLNDLAGLQNLSSIGGLLKIQNNNSLNDIQGMENITNIGALEITGNFHLNSLQGLENIDSLGSLAIVLNESLTNLNGLQNLTTIGGTLNITNSFALTSLESLQNLTSVGALVISNSAVESLNGLQNLSSVGGLLKINNNNSLGSLSPLQGLSSIQGDLEINNNDSLADCCVVLLLMGNVEGDISLYDNISICNSIESIGSYCITEANLQAQAFFDENANGLFDSNEQSLFQSFNLEPSALLSFSNESGLAYFFLDNFGEYELSINDTNPLWTDSNGPVTVNYVNSTINDTTYSLPMVPTAVFTIQNVDITSSITRCNQEVNYWITYANTGTTINDGYVELIPNNLSDFVYANPPADSSAGNTLYWFYEDLYPTYSQQIHLVYQMPGVEEIGQQINFEANIETYDGYGDHKAVLSSELICAYDPNDKLANPSGYGAENYTLFGDTLEYTVRFQNTGNDTAFTVIIEDELSEYLDLNTFRPVSSSHDVETRIDANTRLATFTFNDIYLPDSNVNEVGSHGFVKYQILGNDNLEENTVIENTASIFFDANPAIVTNTTSNQMVAVLPILPILTASTDAIDFGEINIEDLEANNQPQILFIENPGDLDLIIENMEVQGTGFSAQIQAQTISGQGNTMVLIYFQPSEVGIYQSQLTLYSNAGQLSIDLSGTAVIGTGVENIYAPSLSLFPNPNNGHFYLQSEDEDVLSYQVFNSLGKLVLEGFPNRDLMPIDLSKQGKGLYFMAVQTNEGTFVEKVVVQ